jgi:hypothetical protein
LGDGVVEVDERRRSGSGKGWGWWGRGIVVSDGANNSVASCNFGWSKPYWFHQICWQMPQTSSNWLASSSSASCSLLAAGGLVTLMAGGSWSSSELDGVKGGLQERNWECVEGNEDGAFMFNGILNCLWVLNVRWRKVEDGMGIGSSVPLVLAAALKLDLAQRSIFVVSSQLEAIGTEPKLAKKTFFTAACPWPFFNTDNFSMSEFTWTGPAAPAWPSSASPFPPPFPHHRRHRNFGFCPLISLLSFGGRQLGCQSWMCEPKVTNDLGQAAKSGTFPLLKPIKRLGKESLLAVTQKLGCQMRPLVSPLLDCQPDWVAAGGGN